MCVRKSKSADLQSATLDGRLEEIRRSDWLTVCVQFQQGSEFKHHPTITSHAASLCCLPLRFNLVCFIGKNLYGQSICSCVQFV